MIHICVLSGLLMLAIWMWYINYKQVKSFQRDAKMGYRVRIDSRGERIEGTIVGSGVLQVNVQSDDGHLYHRLRTEIWPL